MTTGKIVIENAAEFAREAERLCDIQGTQVNYYSQGNFKQCQNQIL